MSRDHTERPTDPSRPWDPAAAVADQKATAVPADTAREAAPKERRARSAEAAEEADGREAAEEADLRQAAPETDGRKSTTKADGRKSTMKDVSPEEVREHLRRRAIFLRELAEARELRRRVTPHRSRRARIHAALRHRTFRIN
jgi:hypothetical protein